MYLSTRETCSQLNGQLTVNCLQPNFSSFMKTGPANPNFPLMKIGLNMHQNM